MDVLPAPIRPTSTRLDRAVVAGRGAAAVLRDMSAKASTGLLRQHIGARVSRFFILLFVLFLALLAAGFLVVGAFPPAAHRAPVEHVLSNDKFH